MGCERKSARSKIARVPDGFERILLYSLTCGKLITLGASLACYEMRPGIMTANYEFAIPYAEPSLQTHSPGQTQRYVRCS